MIQFDCPHCGNELRVSDEAAGRNGNCKKCGKLLVVPSASVEPLEVEGILLPVAQTALTPVPTITIEPVDTRLSLLDRLRNQLEEFIFAIDNDAKAFVSQGKEMMAAECISTNKAQIKMIHEHLRVPFVNIWAFRKELAHLGSKRLPKLGYELDLVSSGNLTQNDDLYGVYLRKVKKVGYSRQHWCIDSLILNEIGYMLDTLAIVVEPEFFYTNDGSIDTFDQSEEQYVPPEVKLAVWGRDQGKCKLCGATDRLTYEKIIPVSQGGSDTEENVRLICSTCAAQGI